MFNKNASLQSVLLKERCADVIKSCFLFLWCSSICSASCWLHLSIFLILHAFLLNLNKNFLNFFVIEKKTTGIAYLLQYSPLCVLSMTARLLLFVSRFVTNEELNCFVPCGHHFTCKNTIERRIMCRTIAALKSRESNQEAWRGNKKLNNSETCCLVSNEIFNAELRKKPYFSAVFVARILSMSYWLWNRYDSAEKRGTGSWMA